MKSIIRRGLGCQPRHGIFQSLAQDLLVVVVDESSIVPAILYLSPKKYPNIRLLSKRGKFY